jgi:aspartyl/glutamyl-tRNA(Asn/Gln) amidotransferase C subunit
MDEKEIKKLAKLAHIQIDDKEIPTISENLARIVDYVSEIQNASTREETKPEAGIVSPKPLAEAGELRNVFRRDSYPHETGKYSEPILENVPDREGDYIKVKKIL